MTNECLYWPCKYCGKNYIAGACPDSNCVVHHIEKSEKGNMKKMQDIVDAVVMRGTSFVRVSEDGIKHIPHDDVLKLD